MSWITKIKLYAFLLKQRLKNISHSNKYPRANLNASPAKGGLTDFATKESFPYFFCP